MTVSKHNISHDGDILATLDVSSDQMNAYVNGHCVASVYRKKHGASMSLFPYKQGTTHGRQHDGLDALLEQWDGHKSGYNSGKAALRELGQALASEEESSSQESSEESSQEEPAENPEVQTERLAREADYRRLTGYRGESLEPAL